MYSGKVANLVNNKDIANITDTSTLQSGAIK